MRALSTVIVLASLVFAAPGSARADEGSTVSLAVTGQAPVTHNRAKTRALDAAFVQAVRRVAKGLLPATLSRSEKIQVDNSVYRRARRFVVSYRVDSENSDGERLVVAITARVSADRIRAVIGELNLHPIQGHVAKVAERPRVLLVGAWNDGESGNTSLDSPSSPHRRLVLDALAELGLEFLDAGGSSGGRGDWLAAARQSGAGAILRVSVEARDRGCIRATALHGAAAKVHIEIVDIRGGQNEVAESRKVAGGYGGDARAARRKAGAEALHRAIAVVRPVLERAWPRAAAKGGVTLSIAGARSYGPIRAIERQLARSSAAIAIRRRIFGGGVINLVVDSKLSSQRIAALVGSISLRSGKIEARPRGRQAVDVAVGPGIGFD